MLRQAIEGSEFSQDISILGYIDDDDLDYLFKNCAVFCMPSFYEGFGLPQFEANAVGAKVVGSYYSELRYYKDYKGVFLFDYRVDNLTHIIQRSLNAEASVEKISLQPGVEELINAVRHAVDIR